MQHFPVYKDECRLIFRRLGESAKLMVVEEDARIWHAATPAAVWTELERLSCSFECSAFLEGATPVASKRRDTTSRLYEREVWHGLVRELPGSSNGFQHLKISEKPQGTCESMARCVYTSAKETVQLWLHTVWSDFAFVSLDVSDYKEEQMYLRARHVELPSLGSLGVQANQMRLLRIRWQFAAKGGRVYLDASAEF